MYVTNGWSVVYALDATSGAEIWRYDPQVDRSYVRLACCGPAHNRGVAAYQGKIYVATFDGRLIAHRRTRRQPALGRRHLSSVSFRTL